ncbi:MAG TPA: FKBP-type peptidyl-prolyl cis-trans isomerase [Bacteroidales bacterium]|nr:FKBP-type peptidyl-prolyl cis-trans isomerase [Bacteroidales bacterium]
MKNRLIVLTIISAFFLGSCSSNLSNVKIKTKEDSLSYAVGSFTYNQIAGDSLDLDPMLIGKAFQDGNDGKLLMDDMVARDFIIDYLNRKQLTKYQDHKVKNEAYIEQNKTKEGVTTTESGLQYEVIKMGTGPKPTAENTVKVHYTGMFIDGTQFESSVTNNEPVTFPVMGVIPGWSEGLQLMPVGSKFKFTIPQNLAYGEQGAGGGVIEPYSALIFEVELIEIVKE